MSDETPGLVEDEDEPDDDDDGEDLPLWRRGWAQAVAGAALVIGGAFFGWQLRSTPSARLGDGAMSSAADSAARRAESAFRKAVEAKHLFEAGDIARAEVLMTEASSLYPEAAELQDSLVSIRANAAFQRKDYARFLELAEEGARRRPDSAAFAGTLASALATQYAATGDSAYRTRAEAALAKAQTLSERSPEARKQYEEYADRVRHRLRTREIVDRAEYDRRFRQTAPAR
jgi:hypothetical protein